MKINYGLWWDEIKGTKKVRRNQNFSIEHEMDWDNQDHHIEFRELIMKKHPGTHIIGYVMDESDKIQVDELPESITVNEVLANEEINKRYGI